MSPTVLAIVTGLSLALAAIMSAVAWRVSRAERRRGEARIAVLSAEIHDDGSRAPVAATAGRPVEIGIRGEPPRRYAFPPHGSRRSLSQDLPLRDVEHDLAPAAELFTAARSDSSGTRLVAVVALGVFVIAAVAALAIVFSSAWQPVSPSDVAVRASTPADAVPAAPLELLRLTHEREGRRLTISGVVHNPVSAAPIDVLDAVVAVYDRGGALMTTARAHLERMPIMPDGESPFTVTIPDAVSVGRYRVSFRVGDRAVAHVDRRSRDDTGGQFRPKPEPAPDGDSTIESAPAVGKVK
jgi:hypothetical protein